MPSMSEPAQEYNKALNRLLMRVKRRAEKSTAEYLTRTFVPVEPVPGPLESSDNQVIYGRHRGPAIQLPTGVAR
jgi:hypothetical protein